MKAYLILLSLTCLSSWAQTAAPGVPNGQYEVTVDGKTFKYVIINQMKYDKIEDYVESLPQYKIYQANIDKLNEQKTKLRKDQEMTMSGEKRTEYEKQITKLDEGISNWRKAQRGMMERYWNMYKNLPTITSTQ